MADFTFGDHRATTDAGKSTSDVDSGEPGSNGEGTSATSGDTGTTGPTGGIEGQPTDANAPFGYTKDGTPRKRRAGGGRKPASDTASGTASANASTTDKSNKAGLGVKNDRTKVRANIAGLHAMAAVLTKQEILNLKEQEADALTNSLCDVADHHGINLISAGGAFGLYASLATTAYMIYVPRIIYMKHMKAAENAKPVHPTGNEYNREEVRPRGGTMDFSNDTAH